ncbi:MAG TPA: aminotransferase class III-fold pyridoxal phosphate-dependent enzyme [Vicinamibacterales bacterium]|nr:aminotransferase class III-fold pyridoxal phosphate-dependent enzyme [Vicinamibacterales bacterium]
MSRLGELVPGGCHTYSKGDDRFPSNAPATIVRGKGGLVWDADGRNYVDWGMGINNVLIGHAEERIDGPAISALLGGQAFSRPSDLEEEAAEAVLSLFPHGEMIKFCKNGSDANNAAIRLARAITGRQHIAFDGAAPFFSTADWWCSHQSKYAGTLDADRGFGIPFRFNDVESLAKAFDTRPLACVILELARYERPTNDFLAALKILCERHSTLLIVDEVVTGYRYAQRGLANAFGVLPDLFTLGKGIANGYGVAALVGRREYMLYGAGDVFLLSTTNGAERSGLAAAIATARFYRENDVIVKLAAVGKSLRDRVAAILGNTIVHVQTDFDCRPRFVIDARFHAKFYETLITHGVLMPPAWCCPCFQRTDEEMQRTEAAIRAALEVCQ